MFKLIQSQFKFRTALDRPVFIWGAPRSGTTLLYDLIRKHPDVATLTDSAGKPREGTEFWWNSLGEQRGVLNAGSATSGQIRQIQNSYGAMLKRLNKPRLLEKIPFMVLWIPLVNEVFPDARHFHIIRDGRAVVNSVLYKLRYSKQEKDRIFVTGQQFYGPQPQELTNPLSMPPAQRHAQQWKLLTQQGQRNAAFLGDRYYELRYEDLTGDLQSIMRQVLNHAQLTYDDAFIESHYSAHLDNRNKKWQSGQQAPVSDGFTAHSAIEDGDLPYLEQIKPFLQALGYNE